MILLLAAAVFTSDPQHLVLGRADTGADLELRASGGDKVTFSASIGGHTSGLPFSRVSNSRGANHPSSCWLARVPSTHFFVSPLIFSSFRTYPRSP